MVETSRSRHSAMMVVRSRERTSLSSDTIKAVELRKHTPPGDQVFSSAKGNGKATTPEQHQSILDAHLPARGWTCEWPHSGAFAPKPRLGRKRIHYSWNGEIQSKEPWKQMESSRRSPTSENFGPAQEFSKQQYQHNHLGSRAFRAQLGDRGLTQIKAGQTADAGKPQREQRVRTQPTDRW